MKSNQQNRLLTLSGITFALLAILLTIGCEVRILPSDDDLTSDKELDERFSEYTTFELFPADIYEQALAAGPNGFIEINLPNNNGQIWVAEVRHANTINRNAGGETGLGAHSITLEGAIKETGSTARFVVSYSHFDGTIAENGRIWYVNSLSKLVTAVPQQRDQYVLYRK